ncbi:MAG: PAS domain S-box protein [Bacteroidota bacterium]|nr:PAS domain S-box protein [Bacteroidota bacterium]
MRKYLIADPSHANIAILKKFLLKFDQHSKILQTDSGLGILSMAAKEKVDIIFIHPELSGTKGAEISQELKLNHLTKHIPVILTGTEQDIQNIAHDIEESHADAILKFPVDEVMLKLQLQTLLKLSQLNRKERGGDIDITDGRQAEKALAESEEKFRAVIEKSSDGILITNDRGLIVEMNHSLETITGFSKKDSIGIPIWDFHFELALLNEKNQESFEFLKGNMEQMLNSRLSESFEEPTERKIRNKKGQLRFIETTFYPVETHEKHFLVSVIRDITERKLFDEALKNSESKYYGIFDANKDGISIFVINPDQTLSNFVEANKAASEMLGYTKEEFLQLNVFDLEIDTENRSISKRIDKLKKNKHVNIETAVRHKDGHVINVDVNIIPIHYNNQLAVMNIVRDISERIKAGKAIADERILLRTLINNIPDLIYVKDTSGRKIISNKADLELMGFNDEKEVIGKTDFELFDLSIGNQTYPDDLSVVQSAKPIINKIEMFKAPNGEEKYFSTSKVPLSNDSGEIIGLVGVGHDITRERRTEQKLIQLSKGIEQSPASIIITDTNGNIEYINQKLTEITGYSFDEVLGKNPSIFQSGYTTADEYKLLWKTISEGNEYQNEIQNRKRNGELFWESVLISPIRDESGKIVNYMAIKEDITDRKKTDLEIQKLSVALEQNPASVIITNTQGVIEYVNKKFISVSGYTRKELIGKVVRILKAGHTPDEIYIEIWNKLFAGQEWRGEHQNRTKKREKYWESVLISPIRNQEGKVTNFIILSEDISERKKMEKDLIAAKEKAEESDRLKSSFLANMSHEIRTPLNSILGFSDLLTEPNLDPASKIEFADLINTSGNNLLAIINDVLDISKIEAGQVVLFESEVSAQKLISEIQKEYSYKANAKKIELRLAPNIRENNIILTSDEMRVKQVLINFVANAIKFTEKGYIEIGVSLVNQTIQFHVKDTGIGIPKEFHDKVFDRFRQVETSRSRKYGGNGLGLAITKNLAELLGGKIWLESEPNKGSTFYFALPQLLLISE